MSIPPSQKFYTTMTDAELFARIQDGNECAFDELYDRYNKRVYAYCYAILKDYILAQDAFQATMSSVFVHRESFKGGNVEAWIFTIARNYCLKTKRDTKNTVPIEEFHDTLPDYSTTDDDYLQSQFIAQAVQSLPDIYREMIELRYFGEMSYEEISSRLDIDLSVVKVRLFRAKKLLAEKLQQLQNY